MATGGLEDDWDFLPPRKIKALCAWKPRKWEKCLQTENPRDKKPEIRQCLSGGDVSYWSREKKAGNKSKNWGINPLGRYPAKYWYPKRCGEKKEVIHIF